MKQGLWAVNILLGFVTALLLVVPMPVNAAKPPNGLQVSPLRVYPSQEPGSTTNGSLTLTNYTPDTQQVSLSAETFQTTGEEYHYAFGSSEAAKWVTFAEPTVTLAPKEAKVANYSIAVPVNASPGGKYLALISSIVPTTNNQKITEIHRVASLVYLQVNGALTKNGQLLSLDVPRVASKPVFPALVRLNNGGNTHFQTRVGFYVNRWPLPGKGTYVTQLEGYVLPGTVRQLSTDMYNPRSPGIYRVTAEYSPPQGGVTRVSHIVFYIPNWFVGVIVVLLLCILILIIKFWQGKPQSRKKRTVPE